MCRSTIPSSIASTAADPFSPALDAGTSSSRAAAAADESLRSRTLACAASADGTASTSCSAGVLPTEPPWQATNSLSAAAATFSGATLAPVQAFPCRCCRHGTLCADGWLAQTSRRGSTMTPLRACALHLSAGHILKLRRSPVQARSTDCVWSDPAWSSDRGDGLSAFAPPLSRMASRARANFDYCQQSVIDRPPQVRADFTAPELQSGATNVLCNERESSAQTNRPPPTTRQACGVKLQTRAEEITPPSPPFNAKAGRANADLDRLATLPAVVTPRLLRLCCLRRRHCGENHMRRHELSSPMILWGQCTAGVCGKKRITAGSSGAHATEHTRDTHLMFNAHCPWPRRSRTIAGFMLLRRWRSR